MTVRLGSITSSVTSPSPAEKTAPSPDFELRVLLAFTRRLPRIRGAVRVAMLARKFYLRKNRDTVVADALGFKMKLAPSDWVERGLLFWPRLCDYEQFPSLDSH